MSDADVKRWAETWERAGHELDALRRRELRAMTDDDVRRAVADLFSGVAPDDLPPRTTSGLVEQQRLFAALRKRA
ncbi:MAG: hypothetical protein HYU76_05630 [Betaproteobacteria bacterium]|nr:hypothetical protein [Betaproteobacteria bacterium]